MGQQDVDSRAFPAVAPSILSADFGRLSEEVRAVEAAGADVVHVDVMDGHFVPNLTIGPPVVEALRRATDRPLDAHLMVSNPDAMVEPFAEAGCDWISVHVEATAHLHRLVQRIREAGARPGVVLNPHTPVEQVAWVLEELHHVLVMSVNPGFGGQRFLEAMLDKIRALRGRIDARGLGVRIEVDGGVKAANAGRIRAAGADVLVAGSAIFGQRDYAAALEAIRHAATGAA